MEQQEQQSRHSRYSNMHSAYYILASSRQQCSQQTAAVFTTDCSSVHNRLQQCSQQTAAVFTTDCSSVHSRLQQENPEPNQVQTDRQTDSGYNSRTLALTVWGEQDSGGRIHITANNC